MTNILDWQKAQEAERKNNIINSVMKERVNASSSVNQSNHLNEISSQRLLMIAPTFVNRQAMPANAIDTCDVRIFDSNDNTINGLIKKSHENYSNTNAGNYHNGNILSIKIETIPNSSGISLEDIDSTKPHEIANSFNKISNSIGVNRSLNINSPNINLSLNGKQFIEEKSRISTPNKLTKIKTQCSKRKASNCGEYSMVEKKKK